MLRAPASKARDKHSGLRECAGGGGCGRRKGCGGAAEEAAGHAAEEAAEKAAEEARGGAAGKVSVLGWH